MNTLIYFRFIQQDSHIFQREKRKQKEHVKDDMFEHGEELQSLPCASSEYLISSSCIKLTWNSNH